MRPLNVRMAGKPSICGPLLCVVDVHKREWIGRIERVPKTVEDSHHKVKAAFLLLSNTA